MKIKRETRGNIYSKQQVLSVSGEYGIVNQIEFQGRSFAGESVELIILYTLIIPQFNYCQSGGNRTPFFITIYIASGSSEMEVNMRRGFEGITEFVFMEDQIEKADIILIPGSSRKELINRAVELYNAGYAKYILPSGGYNKKLPPYQTEYEFFREEAIKQGLPENAILKEDKASNTYENAKFSYEVCKKEGLKIDKAILVCKNYHSRRAYITYKINFSKNIEIIVQPIIDSKHITRENWMLDYEKRNLVLSEVEKIGKYFKDNIFSLI